MPKKPLSLRIDSELLARVDAVRGDVPRTKFVERALKLFLVEFGTDPYTEPERERVGMSAPVERSPLYERAAAHTRSAPVSRPVVPRVPGVVRGSSLVKRDVRPIPKGKAK